MGGGNGPSTGPHLDIRGLSPRGRGKQSIPNQNAWYRRSIPAWAGETSLADELGHLVRVYPRVGGGNRAQSDLDAFTAGLSPRGRGKHRRIHRGLFDGGSIPAWAGETRPSGMATPLCAVYPRVGGGNLIGGPENWHFDGLSPRGRGKRTAAPQPSPQKGSIPAWAGETSPAAEVARQLEVYPRVGGGNPWMPAGAGRSMGLSPRGRGKPVGPL